MEESNVMSSLACFFFALFCFTFAFTFTFAFQAHAASYHVNKVTGNDGVSCSAAQSAGTAKKTLNGGIGCMVGNDTLVVHGNCDDGTGDYGELLVGWDGSSSASSAVLAEQPGTKVIPNGSGGFYTTIIAGATETPCAKGVEGLEFPGGGGIFTASGTAGVTHHLKFDGVGFAGLPYVFDNTARTFSVGNAADVIVQNSRMTYGGIRAGTSALRLLVKGNHIGPTSPWCLWPATNPEFQGEPCPHGMYICGDDHVIEDNYVHDAGHTCIQISCEQGGISNVVVRRNRMERCRAVGVSLGGSDCKVYSNTVQTWGLAALRVGNVNSLVANNTIAGVDPAFASQDVFGILFNGTGQVVNNIVMNQRGGNTIYFMYGQTGAPLSSSVAHHNVCDVAGNSGCSLVETVDGNIVTNAASGVFTLPSHSVARGAGVVSSEVMTDITGALYGNPPDIGAFTFTTGSDTIDPVVSMTFPEPGAIVSGTVSVTANASDNVAVVGVQFKRGTVDIEAEDVTTPYSTTWNTLVLANGPYVLSATARDAAGNTTVSASVSVTVNNVEVGAGQSGPGSMLLVR